MLMSFYDLIDGANHDILNSPKYEVFLILFLLVIFFLFLGFRYVSIDIYRKKTPPNMNQIYIVPDVAVNLDNTAGIENKLNPILLRSLETNIKRIKSQNINEILVGLQALKYQPNIITLHAIIELIGRKDVSDDIKESAIETIEHIIGIIKK